MSKSSMMLITSKWGDKETFKMIPINKEAPYNEAIFDIDSKVLAIISKEKKESMHMVPKLNEWGDIQGMKIGKRNNGKDYAEERKTMETFYEYYVEKQNEINEILVHLAMNFDTFNTGQYLEGPSPSSAPTPSIITQ
jgi:hypothetical protein